MWRRGEGGARFSLSAGAAASAPRPEATAGSPSRSRAGSAPAMPTGAARPITSDPTRTVASRVRTRPLPGAGRASEVPVGDDIGGSLASGGFGGAEPGMGSRRGDGFLVEDLPSNRDFRAARDTPGPGLGTPPEVCSPGRSSRHTPRQSARNTTGLSPECHRESNGGWGAARTGSRLG
jgi:hypothetical protein